MTCARARGSRAARAPAKGRRREAAASFARRYSFACYGARVPLPGRSLRSTRRNDDRTRASKRATAAPTRTRYAGTRPPSAAKALSDDDEVPRAPARVRRRRVAPTSDDVFSSTEAASDKSDWRARRTTALPRQQSTGYALPSIPGRTNARPPSPGRARTRGERTPTMGAVRPSHSTACR